MTSVLELLNCRNIAKRREQSSLLPLIEQSIEVILESTLADLQSQMVGGDILDRVGLIENDDLVFGKKTRPLLSQREVGEEQRVIDDE